MAEMKYLPDFGAPDPEDRFKEQRQLSRDWKARKNAGFKLVGFWQDTRDKYSVYREHPDPVVNAEPWSGMQSFLLNLAVKEKLAKVESYRGSSYCRVCDLRNNGSLEYSLDGWRWPQGFKHYVSEHNLLPPEDFIKWVNSRSTTDGD